MAFLGFDAESRDRAGLEALDADGLVGLFAIPIGAALDPIERRVDLGDELARSVPGPQPNRAVGLDRRTVGDIGFMGLFFLEGLQRIAGLVQDVVAPA